MEAAPQARAPSPNAVRGRLAAVLAPAAVFYLGLLAQARNLPLLDDYDAGLNFANLLVARHGLRERLLFYATAQHNEYKLLFGHALLWLQLVLTGRVNFWALSFLGNASLLLLAAILWKMFLPTTALPRRIALFLPVTLLLFQYQYVETLNWPLPGLQTLPVLAFAVTSLYLLSRPGSPALAGAIATMTLSIAASGNGFLVVPVGAAMLLLHKRWLPLGLWTAAAAAMAWLYAFHYHPVAHQAPPNPPASPSCFTRTSPTSSASSEPPAATSLPPQPSSSAAPSASGLPGPSAAASCAISPSSASACSSSCSPESPSPASAPRAASCKACPPATACTPISCSSSLGSQSSATSTSTPARR